MTIKPLYPNQPLVEVATEIRFSGNLAVEHVRAEFQKKIKSDYPLLKVPGAQEGIAPSLQPYRFQNAEGDTGIQVAVNSFSYFSHAYPGNKVFLSKVKNALTVFFDLLGEVDVTRIGWRYVNAIPFTRKKDLLPLNRFFENGEYLSLDLAKDLSELSHHALMPIKDRLVNIKIDSATTRREAGEEIFLLDIDVYKSLDNPARMNASLMFDEIKANHDRAYGVFEDIITDNYRAFLKGDQDG